MFEDLAGKVAVVTGGARGLGYQMATALARAGCHVGLLDVSDRVAESAGTLGSEFGVPTASAVCDVTAPASVDAAIGAVADELGTPGVLIAAAGITIHADSLDTTPEDFRKVLDINLNGVFFSCQSFARRVIADGGRASIITIASMSAFAVNIPQRQVSYNASKAGVEQLTRSLAVEWIDQGIRVNAISPGYFRSDMTKQFIEQHPDLGEYWVSLIPAGRMGEPEDLDALTVFLASDASRYVVGECIVIDGGYSLV